MAMTMGGVNNSLTTLNNINSAMQKTTQQIATGTNYPSAKNGSSAYAILKRMDSHISATSQSAQNVQNAGAMIKTAEGATANTITALSTIKEYIMKAADGVATNPDRAALQEGVNQLVSQIDENSHVTYNGKHILDGTEENSGIAGVIGYENFNLGDIRAESLGLVDSQGNVTLDISTQDAAQKSLGIVNNALDTVQNINDSLNMSLDGSAIDASLDEATTQGAYLQRLDYQEALYNTMEENETAAASTIGDTDMAKAAIELNSQKVQEQLALHVNNLYNHNQANIIGLIQQS